MASIRCANAVSAARNFVQLSQHRWGRAPRFDFLLPPPSRRLLSGGGRRRPGVGCDGAFRQMRRGFAGTAARPRTRAVYNPQADDEGNEMVLEITPRAAKRLSEVMTKDANPGLALRIQVESGGCHGFQYLMSLVTLPDSLPSPASAAPPDDPGSVREDDTVFTYSPDDADAGADLAVPKIILDLPSLELLKGSKVDFTMELIGSQFKIVDNPLATSSCGCGTSFDIKI